MHKHRLFIRPDFLRGTVSMLTSAIFFAIPAATATPDSSPASGDTSGALLRYVGGGPGPAAVEDSAGTPRADSAQPVGAGGEVTVKNTDDTVFILRKSRPADISLDVRARVGDLRMRGYGASGGILAGACAINIRPVEDFARSAPFLRGRDFTFSRFGYEPFLMRGGLGYAGIGKGTRIGLAGMHGDWDFRSGEYGNPDSMVILNVNVGYFGFLLERAWTTPKCDFIVGGVLGSGHLDLKFGGIDVEDYSTFANTQEAELDHEAHARMGALELHAGFTYTPLRWFHFGGDVTAPAFLSVQGFAPYTGEFLTVNPGVRVRVVFGNLG